MDGELYGNQKFTLTRELDTYIVSNEIDFNRSPYFLEVIFTLSALSNWDEPLAWT